FRVLPPAACFLAHLRVSSARRSAEKSVLPERAEVGAGNRRQGFPRLARRKAPNEIRILTPFQEDSRADGFISPRPEIRSAAARKGPRIYRRGRAVAHAGDWREHHHLHAGKGVLSGIGAGQGPGPRGQSLFERAEP